MNAVIWIGIVCHPYSAVGGISSINVVTGIAITCDPCVLQVRRSQIGPSACVSVAGIAILRRWHMTVGRSAILLAHDCLDVSGESTIMTTLTTAASILWMRENGCCRKTGITGRVTHRAIVACRYMGAPRLTLYERLESTIMTAKAAVGSGCSLVREIRRGCKIRIVGDSAVAQTTVVICRHVRRITRWFTCGNDCIVTSRTASRDD